MKRSRGRCAAVVSAVVLAIGWLLAGPVLAQSGDDHRPGDPEDPCAIDPDSRACRNTTTVVAYEEYHKRIRSAEMVTPLETNVFVDSVNLYNGSTEFRVVCCRRSKTDPV